MKILIVEDNADSAMALSMLLGFDGHQVHHVSTVAGAKAVDASEVQAALIDLTLPDGSGIEVARHFTDAVRIAMTGHSRADVWADCEQAGFSDLLTKPLDFARLRQILAALDA